MMKRSLYIFIILLAANGLFAQEHLKYQSPPENLARLVDAPATPAVISSPDHQILAVLNRNSYLSIKDLARPELRLAGLRIDPANNGPTRLRYNVDLSFLRLKDKKKLSVAGLPENPRIIDFQWSPDGTKAAFLIAGDNKTEIWWVGLDDLIARRLSTRAVNNVFYNGFSWYPDSKNVLLHAVPADRGPAPEKSPIPEGPVIQDNTSGRKAAVRTYQDMLSSPEDEQMFAYYSVSTLVKTGIDGTEKVLGHNGIFINTEISPDGNYVLVEEVVRPFSYIVPYYRFPQMVMVWDENGETVRKVATLPLAENIPKGFDATRTGPRSFGWRADQPATLYWVEALDNGDPSVKTDTREQIYYLTAPFDGAPEKDITLQLRYGGITWGNDGLAVVSERWRKNRHIVTSFFKPGKGDVEKKKVFDYSYEDRYHLPGSFVTKTNKNGYRVLLTDKKGKKLFLTSPGYSPEGNRPWISSYDLTTGKTVQLWRSEAPYYETPSVIIDPGEGIVLTRRESVNEPPNYFIRNLKNGHLDQLTSFPHPYPQLKGITKKMVHYKRNDGIALTFELYLPAGYKKEDGPLPTFLWAYPREYKSAAAAGQVSGSPYSFIRISPMSAVAMVLEGYAVLNNASFPIVGEGDEEPNNTFIPQLVANAEAAINKAAELGVTDPERVAVGGHSYGAFMTANLLAHSDLFAAGIARSGAYNRTLTPFGFQNEARTYWEAPEIYYEMSPFMHADQVKTPLLMIHGMADNNSGTFPIQSDRFYDALKGHGAVARLVKLPLESHGYQARESILHVLWEELRWLDTYVKNK